MAFKKKKKKPKHQKQKSKVYQDITLFLSPTLERAGLDTGDL
jgi:hypothetical protein